jgi:hypothetical protein
MEVAGSGQSDAVLRYDVHQKTKLDVRADDAALKLHLKAKLRADVQATAADVDRGAVARTVVKISESIKLRVRLEGEVGGSPRDGLAGLAEAFENALTELAAGFENPEGDSPETLVSGLRDAFTGLMDGLRALFSAPTRVPADAPSAEPETLAELEGQAVGAAPVAAQPASASEADGLESGETAAPGPAYARWLSLRRDLHLRFTAGLRVLLPQLSAGTPPDGPGEPGDANAVTEPVRELRARFDLWQRSELHLIDTSV